MFPRLVSDGTEAQFTDSLVIFSGTHGAALTQGVWVILTRAVF